MNKRYYDPENEPSGPGMVGFDADAIEQLDAEQLKTALLKEAEHFGKGEDGIPMES